MSVANFKPTLWNGALLANFHSTSVLDTISTPPAKIKGEKAIFNRVASGTIKDYTGTVAWDEIATDPIEMNYTNKKYFAFSLDDVDRVQLAGDAMQATTQEHAALIVESYDNKGLADMAAGVKAGNTIGTKTAKKTITSPEQLYDYIVDLGTILSTNKVPKANRFVTMNSTALALLSKDKRFTLNYTVLENGVVEGSNINGMTIVCTEEVPSNMVICNWKGAFGADKQLNETEAMRLQSSFADGVRGLCVFGDVVLYAEAIAVLHYEINLGQTATV